MRKIHFLLAILILSTVIVRAQGTGSILGKLTDKEFGEEPLPFANVLIKGTTTGTTSDFDGLYEINGLTPGNYIVVYSYLGYQTREINATVEADKVTTINVPMSASEGVALDEVVISVSTSKESEIALLLDQKKAIEIKTSIGAQELARKGIGNVEDAVVKAAGITKVASRGVVVRGLDERYNFLTINNLPLSPTNWETKIPDLGLFTSSLISKIDVNKIFYTGLYGDFAGATFNVDTKQIPNEGFTKIGFSVGANLQSLENTFITDEEDGSINFFGFGGADARRIPDALSNENSSSGDIFRAQGQDAVDAFESDFDVDVISAPISTGFSIANAGIISNNVEKSRKTAYYFGVNYGNSFNSNLGDSFLRNPQGQLLRTINRNNSFSFSTQSNLLFSIFNRTDKNSIDFNYIFVKSTDTEANDNFGRFAEVSANLQGIESKFVQSTLHQFQVLGAYRFNENNRLRYGATYGTSDYEQPDNTIITLEDQEDGSFLFSTNSGRLFRYFLNTDNNNFAATLGYQVDLSSGRSENKDQFNIGFDFNNETLDVFNRFVLVNLTGIGAINIDPNAIDASLTTAFLADDNTSYVELPDTPFLDISTNIIATNASYNFNFSDKLSLLAGVRLESFTRDVGEDALENSFSFDEFFVLPSFNLKYEVGNTSNLRLAGSRTYTRPKNLEIVPITRQNSVGDLILGNTDLENSDNLNLDLKYEIFPDNNSLFSVNLFTKIIDNPIERLIADSGSFIRTVFDNTDSATLFGAEFEVQSTLGFLLQNESLDNISFGANVTLMDSNVSISDELQQELNLTNTSRRLQGASDFLLNADINYDVTFSPKLKSKFTFLFNTFSERISSVGSGTGSVQYEDEFEQPFNNLSFIWANKIGKGLEASFKVNNILDDTYERTIVNSNPGQTGNVSRVSYQVGTSLSLSCSYKF
ncbi:carboxypeptidase-like regulatory domain-containing protein [Flagellimonas sp. S174]|uniref:TonB-dependent receptor n=1 Tax=Flagellimonas sp. S174 TaxID=3410790 RepID=UPI003BF58E49